MTATYSMELAKAKDRDSGWLAVDTEGTGLRVAGFRDHGIGVSIADGEGQTYVPIAHVAGENCADKTYDKLANYIESRALLIFQNAKYDAHSLWTMGIDALAVDQWFDCAVAAQMVDENYPMKHDLNTLADYYKVGGQKVLDEFVEKQKKSGNQEITWEQIYDYAAQDAKLTYDLAEVLWERLRDEKLTAAFTDKMETMRCAFMMERRGVRLDTAKARELSVRGRAEMKRLTEELGVNLGSSKQLKELLIDQIGLPVVRRTKTGAPSMDKIAMEEYDTMLERMDSPIAKKIKEYRGWQKATTAAYEPYLDLMDEDGRVRTSYRLDRTVTGRWSSEGPNLQQVPKDGDKPWKSGTKACFIPQTGYTLVNFDYSQLELRLACVYAPEESLKAAFAEGRDVFTEMSEGLGMTRQDTKTLTYSMQYGAGVNRVKTAFGISEEEARDRIATYKATFPKFAALNRMCTQQAETEGFITTVGGRKRRLPDVSVEVEPGKWRKRDQSYKAMNSMIQGGAADIVEATLRRLFNEIDNENECRVLLQIHDAFLFEIRDDLVDHYSPRIMEIMRDVSGSTGVPELANVVFDVDGGADYGSSPKYSHKEEA